MRPAAGRRRRASKGATRFTRSGWGDNAGQRDAPTGLTGHQGPGQCRVMEQARRGPASPPGGRREADSLRTELFVEADTATADTASLAESIRLSSSSNEQNHGGSGNAKDSNPARARPAQGHRDR